jgi:hypothetical protein
VRKYEEENGKKKQMRENKKRENREIGREDKG